MYVCACVYISVYVCMTYKNIISYVVLTTEWLPWLQQVKEAVVILR